MHEKFEGTHKEVLDFILRNKKSIHIISRSCKTKTIMISALDGGFGGYEKKEIYSVVYIEI